MSSSNPIQPNPRSSRRAFALVTAGLVAAVGLCVAAAATRSDKWWWDNLGGPDSSNFMNLDQINKSNVNQLEVAWFYPWGGTMFNPIVVDDVMYTMGRGNALVALDATSGKELWIHENMGGLVARGINFWQSEDGRGGRHGQHPRRPAARGEHEPPRAVEQPGQGLEEPDHPRLGAR
jgi:hypothetical protein